MLVSDELNPELSIYFNGAIVLRELQNKPKQKLIDLFENVRRQKEMSFPIFILCLDWLYLIDVAKLSDNGEVILCS